jgi:hypothetical protein
MLNLLSAEPLILARLKAQIAGVTVASVASIAGVVDLAPLLPALFLQPGTAEPTAESGAGLAQAEDELWTVVAAVKHIPDPVELKADYQAAGLLLGQAAGALAGWSPGSSFRPMRYAGRDEPAIEPGHAEFPINFSVRRLFAGTGG